MGRYDDNRHIGEGVTSEGWLGTGAHPRVCTITFTSFRVLTRLCTRLAAVQKILVQLTEDRYWSNVSAIERLDEEIQEESTRNKGFILELQSGHMRHGWQLSRLQADVRFLLERNRELVAERQVMLKAIRDLQGTLEAVLAKDMSPAMEPLD